jgi:branched-chain amino acid aminotransferase
METSTQFAVKKINGSRVKEVDFSNLGFGNEISDHMFVADYINGIWEEARIIPYENLSLAPATLALHYGQTVFEGMKAFRRADGKISIFRIKKHGQRFNKSLQRMCMPEVPEELFEESIKELIKLDHQWVKNVDGSSLYIRPFCIATEDRFGVKVSSTFKFIVFTGPVGAYYSKPLRLKIEDKFIRAASGGTGTAKCGGNYGASFYPAHLAHKQGFDQVIWTDGSNELNIEESGTMNIILVIDGVVTTPALSDTILDGVTRDSILTLAKDLGYKVSERKISSLELIEKFKQGKIQEAFGAGTAAVTSPIASINIKGADYLLPAYNSNSFINKITSLLKDIRIGNAPDKYSWNTII